MKNNRSYVIILCALNFHFEINLALFFGSLYAPDTQKWQYQYFEYHSFIVFIRLVYINLILSISLQQSLYGIKYKPYLLKIYSYTVNHSVEMFPHEVPIILLDTNHIYLWHECRHIVYNMPKVRVDSISYIFSTYTVKEGNFEHFWNCNFFVEYNFMHLKD